MDSDVQTERAFAHGTLGTQVAREKAAIEDIVVNIEKSAAVASDLVASLYGKFATVLSQEVNATSQDPPVSPMAGSSPLYENLYRHNNSLHRLIDQLDNLKRLAEV